MIDTYLANRGETSREKRKTADQRKANIEIIGIKGSNSEN